MSGTKDMVHTEYLKSLEAKRSLPELAWEQRTVLIIGSDRAVNVGAWVAAKVADRGGKVIEVDKRMQTDQLFEFSQKSTDLVICCASVHMDWIENLRVGEIDFVIENSLVSPIHYTSVFAWSHMDTDHRKHIAFVGSMAHRQVLNASAPYCAAKAGLAHFVRCAAWELTPKGFTVGIVHPGNIVDTPMTQATIEGIMEYRNMTYDEAERYWSSVKLTDRWLNAGDVANEVVDLLVATPHHSGVQIELAGGLR